MAERKTKLPEASSEEKEHKFKNRLIHEKSPYLLQHAHNPVDWYPWGEEAFKKARDEGKPIFLSVGYSTCHWCHVMEHESFEDEETAEVMNKLFVSIKVDREERPDVDKVYMTYVQATQGGGGWPMSVWLTPSLKPIVGGTYFPPKDMYGRPSFKTILRRVADIWKRQREKIEADSDRVIREIQSSLLEESQSSPNDMSVIEKNTFKYGFQKFRSSYDNELGGFGDAPKFPRPSVFNFLFQIYSIGDERKADADAKKRGELSLEMCLFTLEKMAKGGMHDHLGGGFHRYSTTSDWHIPHYEKMLYDQAQLANSYIDAFQITKREDMAVVAKDIMQYTMSTITSPEGGVYSAEDADSLPPPHKRGKSMKKLEGAFFVWEEKEIDEILKEDAAIFKKVYGVKKGGNAPEGADPHGELKNQNTLIIRYSESEIAKEEKKPVEEIKRLLEEWRRKVYVEREKRPRPHLDDKIITAWNGLMIGAYARAFQVFGDEKYLTAATRAADFIRKQLYKPDSKTLIRNYREGASSVAAFAEDYAFLISGLLDLYEASFDVKWLQWGYELQQRQDELFWDKKNHGYFNAAVGDKSLLFRAKEDYDGAEPSYNSVSAVNLIRFGHMLNKNEFLEKAKQLILSFRDRLSQAPIVLPHMGVAADMYLRPPRQIVIAGRPNSPDTKELLKVVHSKFIPNKVLLLADGGEGQEFIGSHTESFSGMTPKDGKATAYVCQNFTCAKPVNDVEALRGLLQ